MGLQSTALPTGKPSVTTVEVEVNGQRVENGAVISAVGPMTVTSPSRIRVVVDGVEWQPVSSDSGTDTYALTVGGRVLMFDNNGIVFAFLNELEPDFEYGNNIARFVTPGGTIEARAMGRYVQTSYPANSERMVVSVYPNSMEGINELAASVNQEGASVSTSIRENYAILTVTGYDDAKPLQLYFGNVLLVYVTVN